MHRASKLGLVFERKLDDGGSMHNMFVSSVSWIGYNVWNRHNLDATNGNKSSSISVHDHISNMCRTIGCADKK